METIECEKPSLLNDTCSVRIVDDFKFRAVDAIAKEVQPEFCVWWPNAARILVNGIFGDQEQRRSAARAMLTLVDFKQTEARDEHVLTSEDECALRDMYATRLMFDEQQVKLLREVWADRVDQVFEKGSRVIRKSTALLETMRILAKKLEEEHRDNPVVHSIIQEELSRAKERLACDTNQSIRLIKAEACTDLQHSSPNLHQLDQRIWKCAQRLDSAVAERIRAAYRAHYRNIEYTAATALNDACRQKWIQGLR